MLNFNVGGQVVALAIVADGIDKGLAILVAFTLADAVNVDELVEGNGAAASQIAENGVAKNDISRELLFRSNSSAELAQSFEKVLVHTLPGFGGDFGGFAATKDGFE